MTNSRYDRQTDVLVIGSGAGGLTTALTAHLCGLEVIVVEKEPVFGGTTAWSGGVAWIPCNSHARAAGINDSAEAALRYLRHCCGEFYDHDRIAAFVDYGPEMIDFLERETEVKFELASEPDYQSNAPGALRRGRALRPIDFDARRLGKHHSDLRPPARERVLFMGMQIGAAHLGHFLNATKSLESFSFVARRMVRYVHDALIYRRSMTLAMGNALIARLAKSLFDFGIGLSLGTPALRLIVEDGVVVGAVVKTEGRDLRIVARKGVVLASGGFPHDYDRRRSVFPHHPSMTEHLSNAPLSNTGDGIRLAETVGGVFDASYPNVATWYPTSHVKYGDGSEGNNPHLLERGKPGVIAVALDGRRFTNESQNYHDFVQAMFRSRTGDREIVAFYVCDHRAFRRYGLGVARPWPLPYRQYLRTGYLKRGATIQELAAVIGIDPDELERTVDRYNAHARLGRDPEFGKGESEYDISQGDPTQSPNPCVAPLETPPFYAVKILPGDLGTFAGLRTDRHGCVLDLAGRAIPGLFAVGNDQASVFGGAYPGGGATLGPAMTFGYLAARRMAGTI